MTQKEQDQKILNAYYAGFHQAHYSHVHPERFPPKEMIEAVKEWFKKEYGRDLDIHHGGFIIDQEWLDFEAKYCNKKK